MPLPQLFTSPLEKGANRLLQMADNGQALLQPLKGRSLAIELTELPVPLIFIFSDEVHILGGDASACDCYIKTSVFTLGQLQDAAHLTQLIRNHELTLEGDLTVAQQFSRLFKELDIDIEEQLSRYLGDILAHRLYQASQDVRRGAGKKADELRQQFADVLLDERPLAVHRLEAQAFGNQVLGLRDDAERLQAQLSQLQQRMESTAD